MSNVRVAVVGCGYWGRNLVRNFSELGVLAAIVDPDHDAANALAEQYGVPVLSEKSVLDDKTIHAIATASPATLHHKITMQALDAGKHVFVEKPIALTLEDGAEMRDRAAELGLTLMVGHVLQYHLAYRRLRELVNDGAIGDLRYIYSNRMSMGKYRVEEDVVWSFAPHDLSMILGLMGKSPETVTTQGAVLVSPDKFDSAHVHLTFEGGVKAHIFASWLSPFKEHKFVAIGETGSLIFDDTAAWADKLVLTRHVMVDGPALQKGTTEAIELGWAEPLKEECRHFIMSAERGEAPPTDADEALRVLDALIRSERSGKTGETA